jgi:4-hydroxybenzoate polyprenyltransferase
MNGIVLEVGRKIRTPEMESEGVLTYTSMLGIPKAISLWIGILFVTLCLSISASYYADLGNLAYVVLGIVFVICAVPALLFAKNKTKSMAKGVEIASAFWTICMYFILGAAPMIQKLIFD